MHMSLADILALAQLVVAVIALAVQLGLNRALKKISAWQPKPPPGLFLSTASVIVYLALAIFAALILVIEKA
jgi:hypothetical protein